MKRILCLLMALMMCLCCACADEIGELKPPTQEIDPNEIMEQGTQQKEQYETEGLDWITPAAPATEPIEEPVVEPIMEPIMEPIEEPVVEPIEEPIEAPAASAAAGELITVGNVTFALPEGWEKSADSEEGGVRMVSASSGMNQLQIQSQAIYGSLEEMNAMINMVGSEGMLEMIVGGTLSGFGLTEFDYTYAEYKGIPCLTVNVDINMGEMPCGMGIAVMLDGCNMTMAMVMAIFGTAAESGPVLAAVLTPMTAQ